MDVVSFSMLPEQRRERSSNSKPNGNSNQHFKRKLQQHNQMERVRVLPILNQLTWVAHATGLRLTQVSLPGPLRGVPAASHAQGRSCGHRRELAVAGTGVGVDLKGLLGV